LPILAPNTAERFEEQGYHGVILPVPGHGSLAVLARGQSPGPDMLRQIASRLQDALVWTG
jgi:alpha-beta hydrolase superfamily lysophospholipase